MINKKTGVEPNDSDEIENISGIAGDEPSSTGFVYQKSCLDQGLCCIL